MDQLIANHNQQIALLTNTYNANVRTVRNLRGITNARRNVLINQLTNNYRVAITNLQNKFQQDMKVLQDEKNKGKKTALLIGINYFNTRYRLYGCINDTISMKKLLSEKYGFTNFIELTDATNNPLKPTKKNIIDNLTKLLVNSKSGDQIVFFYSGHGITSKDLNGDEISGLDNLLVPSDSTENSKNYIVDDELKDIFNKYLKQGVQVFSLLDCCFSGTGLDLKYNYLDTTNEGKLTTNEKQSETQGQVIMISGCTDYQTSSDVQFTDSSNNKFYGGAVTYSFLKCLSPNISYKSLIEKMRQVLSNEGHSQIPQLSSGKLIDINLTQFKL